MDETLPPLQNADSIRDDALGRGPEIEAHTLREILVLQEEARKTHFLSLCPPSKSSFYCYLRARKKPIGTPGRSPSEL